PRRHPERGREGREVFRRHRMAVQEDDHEPRLGHVADGERLERHQGHDNTMNEGGGWRTDSVTIGTSRDGWRRPLTILTAAGARGPGGPMTGPLRGTGFMTTASSFEALLVAARSIASEVASVYAGDVDTRARFPRETIDALRQARLLSAPVPRELGGAGCSMSELALLCSTLSQACSASGMVLAMHYIEVACLARHGMACAFFRDYMQSLCEHQWLIASVTSEVGTFGDTRSSLCAVEAHGGRFDLRKDATTV